jgi:hypothetical protein
MGGKLGRTGADNGEVNKNFLEIFLLKLSTKNKKCGAMWSKVDIFSLL